ncbi:MAG TPA: hypothetical protein PLY93_12275 [Turneriella sp.]|nr:hypothetical protein [Turneriella sp.]
MILTYYLDSSLNPVPTGNAFGRASKVHTLLNWHPRWQYLSPNEMRRKIVTASAQLDNLSYKGSKADPAQPMQFPRSMGQDPAFSLDEQIRRLLSALVQQVEYNLNRAGMGMPQYGHGNEQFTARQDTISREALQTLYPYLA